MATKEPINLREWRAIPRVLPSEDVCSHADGLGAPHLDERKDQSTRT